MARKKCISEVKDILAKMDLMPTESDSYNLWIVDRARESIKCIAELIDSSQASDVVPTLNYCRIKMEYAIRLIGSGNGEEGVEFMRGVLRFFLREVDRPEAR